MTTTPEDRFWALLERLDARAEAAAFLPGADRLQAVQIMARYHTAAGFFEHRAAVRYEAMNRPIQRRYTATMVRALRHILAEHREACVAPVL